MKDLIKFIKKLTGEKKYIKLKCIFIFLIQKIGLEKFLLEIIFNKKLGYKLNFSENPETFNQKIQFRKVFDKNPLYTLCADKYRVREYVKEKIGEEYLIPLHLVTEKLSKDQWEELPNEFIAKANNNSGPVQIITDKSNTSYEKVSKELHRQLDEEYGTVSMERYYDEIEPIITVEKLLPGNPKDYKFHCFKQKNGEFKFFIQLDYDRENSHKKIIYDENFNKLPLEYNIPSGNENFKKPDKFENMKKLASKLAEDFDYVRTDFYNVGGKIYFGELTFCAANGLGKFSPREWDYKWGSYWNQKLTEKKYKI